MVMKQSSLDTSNESVTTAEKLLTQDYTLPTSSYPELLEYALSLKAKADSLQQIAQRCNESSETTLKKIFDLFSKEISSLDVGAKQVILHGQ